MAAQAVVRLAYAWTRVRAPVAPASLAISRPRLHHAIHLAHGELPVKVGSATSQLDLPSLTTLSVAGCSREQLGVPHSATSVITESS